MNSPTPLSETHIRRHGKGIRSSKKSVFMYSDYYEEKDNGDNSLGQRSVSLTTLQPSVPVIQPRMAQLETLEAKMASIEVSLSTTPRRRKNGSIGGGSAGGRTSLGNGNTNRTVSETSSPVSRELENLRLALRDKENIIQSLKGQINSTSTRGGLPSGILRGALGPGSRALSLSEKRQAEERLAKVKHDMDIKRLAIKNLKMALERLDITDNIDVRIQQAELEYQLGREELNALSLLEEARALQLCLDDSQYNGNKSQTTLFSCTRSTEGHVTLHSVEVACDPKSPRFGASTTTGGTSTGPPGLIIDWALEETGLCKGDRVIEVNGKLVLNKTKEDMLRLLAVAPDPAQIVILRVHPRGLTCLQSTANPKTTSNEVANLRSELSLIRERAEEAQRIKEGLKGDNLRLTHRISYLEEQVAELLQRRNADGDDKSGASVASTPTTTSTSQQHNSALISTVKTRENVTNISITSPPASPNRAADGTESRSTGDIQVFQKGPKVTALVANLPGMDIDDRDMLRTLRSNTVQCNISSTHIPAPDETYKNHKPRYSRHLHSSKQVDYNSESSSAVEHVRRSHHSHYHHHRKSTESSEHHSRKSLSAIESIARRHIPKISDSKSVDRLDSEPVLSRLQDARSVKSLDFDSEPSNTHYAKPDRSYHKKIIDYTSEPNASDKKIQPNYHHPCNGDPRSRPKPPKKPIRLSLHRAQSLQSVETLPTHLTSVSDKEGENRKPTKRNHKGEAPQVPVLTLKVDRPYERSSRTENHENGSSRASSRTDNCQSALRWPSALQQMGYPKGSNSNRYNGHVSDGGRWC